MIVLTLLGRLLFYKEKPIFEFHNLAIFLVQIRCIKLCYFQEQKGKAQSSQTVEPLLTDIESLTAKLKSTTNPPNTKKAYAKDVLKYGFISPTTGWREVHFPSRYKPKKSDINVIDGIEDSTDEETNTLPGLITFLLSILCSTWNIALIKTDLFLKIRAFFKVLVILQRSGHKMLNWWVKMIFNRQVAASVSRPQGIWICLGLLRKNWTASKIVPFFFLCLFQIMPDSSEGKD